jgi:hypothetical protein
MGWKRIEKKSQSHLGEHGTGFLLARKREEREAGSKARFCLCTLIYLPNSRSPLSDRDSLRTR